MMNKKSFGIDKKEAAYMTFLTNDWQHSILVNDNAHPGYQTKAQVLIASQLLVSSAAVIYCQATQNTLLSVTSIIALMYSVMALSNATKNQRDAFSSFMQSYYSKVSSAFGFSFVAYKEVGTPAAYIFGAYAGLLIIDAVIGLIILYQVFAYERQNEQIVDDFLAADEQEKVEKEYNDRMPSVLRDIKIFNKGWKFNLFNVFGQIWKQIAAVMVIFAMSQFAIVGIIFGQERCFSILVLTYSLICLFSFFNLSYVRDFDALQVNIAPITMAVVGLLILQSEGFRYATTGMTITLIADSYYALRYKDESDQIEFNAVELFARESWTSQVFEGRNLTLQIASVSMIFAQIAITLCGFVLGQGYSILIFAFYMVRLIQFFENTMIGMQIFQSNMTCLVLAILAFSSVGTGAFATTSFIILCLDVYIGFTLFQAKHGLKIQEYLKIPALNGIKIRVASQTTDALIGDGYDRI